ARNVYRGSEPEREVKICAHQIIIGVPDGKHHKSKGDPGSESVFADYSSDEVSDAASGKFCEQRSGLSLHHPFVKLDDFGDLEIPADLRPRRDDARQHWRQRWLRGRSEMTLRHHPKRNGSIVIIV